MINWQDRDLKKDDRKHGKGEHMPRPFVVPFKGLRQFNEARSVALLKGRMKFMCESSELYGGELDAVRLHFASEQLQDKLARALAERQCLDLKEFLERCVRPPGEQRRARRAPRRRRRALALPANPSRARPARTAPCFLRAFAVALFLPLAHARSLPPSAAVPRSFEFFTHVRHKRNRAKMCCGVVADLCCGHGFTGLLFAIFEPRVERVLLIDRMRPPAFDRIWEACVSVAPWVREKVQFVILDLATLAAAPRRFLPVGTTVLAVHACGEATDICLDVAVQLGGAAAALPCCHRKQQFGAHNPRPAPVEEHLGRGLAQDIDRTYRMHGAGYNVRWEAIPPEITTKNRLLLCLPRQEQHEDAGDAGSRLSAARQQSCRGLARVAAGLGLMWFLRLGRSA